MILINPVPMWSILHTTMTSLVAVIAPRTGKIIKNDLCVFERVENFANKMVCYTLYLR